MFILSFIAVANKLSMKTITEIVQGSRDGTRKSKGTRVDWLVANVIEHPCYTIVYAGPSFHFGSQNNVAGMLHYIGNQPTYPEQFLYLYLYYLTLLFLEINSITFICHELFAFRL